MNDIGANEEGEVTEPFEHVTYVSFRRVDALDASEVTSTVERDVLSGDVDPDALRPTGTMKAAPVAPEADVELDANDLVIEMESIAARAAASTATPSQRTTHSAMPPPLPPRASRPSLAPVTVRASLPPTERAPSLPPTMPELPPTTPMLLVEPDPPVTVPSGATIRAFPPPPPPPQAAFPPPAPAFPPPAFAAYPLSPPASYGYETPSTAPVAMSVSFGHEAPLPAPRRKGMRLSPAALASLALLFVGSAIAFGTVLVLRSGRTTTAASSPPETRSEPPSASPQAQPASVAETVPTVAPAALPSVVVGVDSLPKASATDPDMTLLTAPASAKGHRVFVDGRVIGNVGGPLKTKCGAHTVKVGSAGKPRLVHLPCGGELALE